MLDSNLYKYSKSRFKKYYGGICFMTCKNIPRKVTLGCEVSIFDSSVSLIKKNPWVLLIPHHVIYSRFPYFSFYVNGWNCIFP